jgi:DNA-directed RNA polymerase specialized sigma24 family protein
MELAGRTYAVSLRFVGWRLEKQVKFTTGAAHDAEDVPWIVTRELVLSPRRRRIAWNPERQSWESYVIGRTIRRLTDAARGNWHLQALAEGQEPVEDGREDSTDVVALYERAMALLNRMATEADRWVYEVVRLQGTMTYAEAARRLKTRPGTLKARISRLRKRMRDMEP